MGQGPGKIPTFYLRVRQQVGKAQADLGRGIPSRQEMAGEREKGGRYPEVVVRRSNGWRGLFHLEAAACG